MKKRFLCSALFFRDGFPIKEVEMFGPTIINALIFLVSSVGKSNESFETCFYLYISALFISVLCLQFVLKCKHADISCAQNISIMSYSSIYFVPFGIISRLLHHKNRVMLFLKMIMLIPSMVLQMYIFLLIID